MRNNVTFQYPAEFVPVSDEDGILAVGGAQWFVALLNRVPDLQVDDELCQEDWGIVVFASRAQKKFWVGLSFWPDGDRAWLAHFHHSSFAWLQRLSASGRKQLQLLVGDFHAVLASEPSVSHIVWHEEGQMNEARPGGHSTPVED